MKPLRLPTCAKCGEPTSHNRRVCKLCEILEKAGVNAPVYSAWKLLGGHR